MNNSRKNSNGSRVFDISLTEVTLFDEKADSKNDTILSQIKNKFTVIKEKYSDINVVNTKLNLDSQYSLNDYTSDNEDENNDVFIDDNFEKKTNFVKNREGEGQDTITSMNNQKFLKKFEKYTSSKTNLNFDQESIGTNGDLEPIQSVSDSSNTLNTIANNITKLKTSLVRSLSLRGKDGIARSRTQTINSSQISIDTETKRNTLLDFIKSDNIFPSVDKDIQNQNQLDISSKSQELSRALLLSETSVNTKSNKINIEENNGNIGVTDFIPTSKSDQVFEVLKEAIENNDDLFLDRNFIDQVMQAVKYAQFKDEKRKDNVKKQFKILFFFLIFGIILMTIFLLFNVCHKLLHIKFIKSGGN